MDARKLAARNKLLEAELPIEVDVEVPERTPVVFEFLFNPRMDLPDNILYVLLLFRRVRLKNCWRSC